MRDEQGESADTKSHVKKIRMKKSSLFAPGVFLGVAAALHLAHTQEERGLAPAIEYAAAIVNEREMPRAVRALSDIGETTKARIWSESLAGMAVVQWIATEPSRVLEPLNVLVPVTVEGRTIGLIALDPRDGSYRWRISDWEGPFPPLSAEAAGQALLTDAPAGVRSALHRLLPRLVLVGFKNYWFFQDPDFPAVFHSRAVECVSPSKSPRIREAMDLVEELKTEESEAMTLSHRPQSYGLHKNEMRPVSVGPHVLNGTPPSSYTKMVGNKVPYYTQGSLPWCGIYCVAMVNQWWNGVDLGDGDVQAQKLADVVDTFSLWAWSPNYGLLPWQIEELMQNLHLADDSYENFQWTWWGTMKSLAESGTSYYSDDIKGMLASDLPVVCLINAEGTGSIPNHYVLAIGYDDTLSEIYINDSGSWVGWPGFDVAVDYDYFENHHWNVFFLLPRPGVVGYPGDFSFPGISVSIPNLPASLNRGEQYELQIACETTNAADAGPCGLHIRVASAEFVSARQEDWDSCSGYEDGETPRSLAGSHIAEFHDSGSVLAEGGTAYAYVSIRPTGAGDVTVFYRAWVYDSDDRYHSPINSMTINDERDEQGGSNAIEMPDPGRLILRNPADVHDDSKGFLEYAVRSAGIAVPSAPMVLFVDDDAPGDPAPADPELSDPLEDGTEFHPFDAIQKTIDRAVNGDEIIVAEGTYAERIQFHGKNIVLRSKDPLDPRVVAKTIIDGNQAGSVVTFSGAEDETCALSGFTLQNGSATCGGGIYGDCTHATIRNNVITDNSAELSGGGLLECNGKIEGNVVVRNWAGRGGGLSWCDGIIQNNAIVENSARDDSIGGDAFAGGLDGCNGLIRGNLIAGNSASGGYGGGLYFCDGAIENNTIVGNSASEGSGLLYCSGTIHNCIIWGNTAPSGPQIHESSAPMYSCIQNWTGGGEGNIALDPKFVDPDGPDNDLATYDDNDYWLSPDSPCIDKGKNGGWMTDAVDLDGNPRIRKGTVDMGAYEYRCRIIAVGNGGGDKFALTWTSRPGETFTVWCCDALESGPWQQRATLSSQGLATSWTDILPIGQVKFYRIEVK